MDDVEFHAIVDAEQRTALARLRDPYFHALVYTLYDHLERSHGDGASFTPTELREAAILAAAMYEERHVRPIMVERRRF